MKRIRQKHGIHLIQKYPLGSGLDSGSWDKTEKMSGLRRFEPSANHRNQAGRLPAFESHSSEVGFAALKKTPIS